MYASSLFPLPSSLWSRAFIRFIHSMTRMRCQSVFFLAILKARAYYSIHCNLPAGHSHILILTISSEAVIPAVLLSGNPVFSQAIAGSPIKAFGDDEQVLVNPINRILVSAQQI